MDWDLKMPSWDFSELDPNIGPNMGPMAGPSTGISVRADDGPLDLKLGGDFVQQRAVEPATTNSPSGSSKRARTPGPSGSPSMVACLVDGCIADLSNCREYHRRHKVCAGHSKTPVVMVRGQEQRFCQQCSRFHLLVEFDEGKRSCRKRLDGHNRRRRKPQPEPISSGSLFANHQGNRFAASSQIFPSTVSDPSWLDTMKPENPPFFASQQPVHFFDSQHHFFRSSFAPSFSLQDSDPQICHSLKSSDCALSLLSSSPPPPRPLTSAINQPPMLSYPGALGLGQYSSGSRQTLLDHASESATGFSCSRMEDDENVAELSCQGLFGEGSSDGGQSLPFSWE